MTTDSKCNAFVLPRRHRGAEWPVWRRGDLTIQPTSRCLQAYISPSIILLGEIGSGAVLCWGPSLRRAHRRVRRPAAHHTRPCRQEKLPRPPPLGPPLPSTVSPRSHEPPYPFHIVLFQHCTWYLYIEFNGYNHLNRLLLLFHAQMHARTHNACQLRN